MFKRQAAASDEFGELESGIDEVMMLDLSPPAEPAQEPVPAEEIDAELEPAAGGWEPRTTAHTQNRLAEFAAFEEMHQATRSDLETLGATLARVNAAHHQAREFLNGIHSGIHRTNELELSVARLGAENRTLFRQAEHVKRLRSQLESLSEAFKQREAKLVETADSLRSTLSATKLELAEAQALVGRLEVERQEIVNALANTSNQSERTARENEMLRERTINLAADFDTVSRKRVDAERKIDEYAAMHERDTTELAEARAKLVNVESERQRLQKQNDSLNSKLIDAVDSLTTMENELGEQAQRHDLAIQGLKNERDTLSARIEVALRAEQECGDRVTDLAYSLKEANDGKRVAEERLASLLKEQERPAGRVEAFV